MINKLVIPRPLPGHIFLTAFIDHFHHEYWSYDQHLRRGFINLGDDHSALCRHR
jgi:hypothetical protein